jgi:dihydrofolate synthase/folylpolyglutamate synthase
MLRDFQEFEAYVSRFTNYERLQAFRYDREGLGLDRMLALARQLGDPQESYPSVHVAGTKGKGTTSLILESLLLARGLRVGTYISPHVEHLRERIRLRGDSISEAELVRELNAALPSLEAHRGDERLSPTFFELMTGLAMALFRRHRVDWGVFEVGLGGRLDATNVLRPQLTAITSIGLEHTQQLGTTLAQIAREKAGIIKEGVPVVLGPLPDEARDEIHGIARRQRARVIPASAGSVQPAGPDGVHVEGVGRLPAGAIRGPALRTDLAIALTMYRAMLDSRSQELERELLARALSGLSLPARVEVLRLRPPVVVDAAHTLESVRALRLTLEEIAFPRPRTLIFSLAAGKNRDPILEEVLGLADDIIWTLADAARSLAPEDLREQTGQGTVVRDPCQALARALTAGRPLVVTGSFYLAGLLRPILRQMEREAVG